MEHKPFICKRPKLEKTERWLNSHLVVFPVSYTYNGGTVIDDEWYSGYEVPAPKVPKGFELVDIGVGLQLNARPPYATKFLRKIKKI